VRIRALTVASEPGVAAAHCHAEAEALEEKVSALARRLTPPEVPLPAASLVTQDTEVYGASGVAGYSEGVHDVRSRSKPGFRSRF
jgi:hypothetical protein